MEVDGKRMDLVMMLGSALETALDSPERRRVLELVPRASKLSKAELSALAYYAVGRKPGGQGGMRWRTRGNAFNATTRVNFWRLQIEAYRTSTRFKAYIAEHSKKWRAMQGPDVTPFFDLKTRFDAGDADTPERLAIAIVAAEWALEGGAGRSTDDPEARIEKWARMARADPDLAEDLDANILATRAWIAAIEGTNTRE